MAFDRFVGLVVVAMTACSAQGATGNASGTGGSMTENASGPAYPAEGTVIQDRGVVERGVECFMLRTADGTRYAVERGVPPDIEALLGRRVVFAGRVMLDSMCQQGIALSIDMLEPE